MHNFAPQAKRWSTKKALQFLREVRGRLDSMKRCDCGKNWDALLDEFPPDVSNRKAFFLWTVDAHNRVNEKLGKPKFSNREAIATYYPSLLKPKGKALITLALDDHREVLELTLPYMEAYAKRIGAELVVLTDNQRITDPMANKWRIGHLAKAFERTLYVDSDVFIKPDAPDIFELPAKLGARDERPDYSYRPGWYESEAAELFFHQGVKHTLERCINGGVLLLTNDTASLYDEPDFSICPRRWCSDQYWLSYRMETNPEKVIWLDDRWNWGFIRNDWWQGLEDAWFIHFNGSRPLAYRKELIAQVIAGDYTKKPMGVVDGWKPEHD
jgi:hypothetical protein